MGRPNIRDLLNLKGVRQLTEVLVRTEDEAAACESMDFFVAMLFFRKEVDGGKSGNILCFEKEPADE